MASTLSISILLLLIVSLSLAESRNLKQKFAGLIKQIEKLENFDLVKAFENSEHAFQNFLSKNKRNYTAASYAHRLKVFEDNLVKAAQHQVDDPTAVHGITIFADITEEEFNSQFLGLRTKDQSEKILGKYPFAPTLDSSDLPQDFDWRDYGAVSSIKNQGMCGSCYAFSAVGAIEGAHYLKTGEMVDFSEQQVVDCDNTCDTEIEDLCDSGCNGGFMNNVFTYVQNAGGLNTEADYPYKGYRDTCKFDKLNAISSSEGFEVIAPKDDQIAANLISRGPLAIGLNAHWMQTYVKGVSCVPLCNKRGIDHGVLLVGYGQSGWSVARLKHLPYWTIKNSWGTSWGENGYYRICKGKNECGVNTMVSAVVSTSVDPEQVANTVASAKAAMKNKFTETQNEETIASI